MFTIKDMQAAGQTSARMVRYWEDTGLLGKVERTEKGMRLYTPKHIEKAKNIRLAKLIGVDLETLRGLGDFVHADIACLRMDALERLKTLGEPLEYDL